VAATVGSTFVASFPYFWTGLLLLYLFAFRLSWFPMSGGSANPPSWTFGFIGDALAHSILPGLTIFISGIGAWALGMRNYTINVLGEDFIKFAQANGVRVRILLVRYAMRNAVLPQLTVFAIVFGNVVGGSLLVEEVFGYPGVGTLLYNAIFNLDYPLMQALFLIITLSVLLANFAVDLLHVRLDPRIAL
jgi:peptide/nickel transport system permease protein